MAQLRRTLCLLIAFSSVAVNADDTLLDQPVSIRLMRGEEAPESEKLLDAADGSIPTAVIMARAHLDAEEAGTRLEACAGDLRAALETP